MVWWRFGVALGVLGWFGVFQWTPGSTQEDPSLFNWKIVDGTLRIKSKKKSDKNARFAFGNKRIRSLDS